MSTYRTPDGAACHDVVGANAGPEFQRLHALCRATLLDSTTLDFVAHYTDGLFDFSVDRLDEPPSEQDTLGGGTRRADLQRFGRSFGFTMTQLDERLAVVNSGRLIRVVLQTENGAAIVNSVVPMEHVIGFALDRVPAHGVRPAFDAEVEAADRALALLAKQLRSLIALGSENPGGFETTSREPTPTAEPTREALVTHVGDDIRGSRMAQLCTGAVRPADLHLVALYSAGEVRFLADCFDHESLGPFFTRTNPSARRAFYEGFGKELDALLPRFNRATRQVLGGLLHRVVLDVEQGAIYCHRLRPGGYLVGVTLSQAQVHVADLRMAELAAAVRDLPGG